MNVVIAGGGTAGHVFPAVALADELSRRGASVEFIGSARGQEASRVPAAGYPFHAVAADQMPRRVSAAAIRSAWTALGSVRACRSIVRTADVVVGVGGYASGPAVLAARRERRPIVLHEQNAVPGLANKLAARWAGTVALTFADAEARLPRGCAVVVTGLPLRERIRGVSASRDALAKEAVEEFGLDPGRLTVVVFGGSQGALHIDRVVAGAIPLLSARDDVQLLVQTGPRNIAEIPVDVPGPATVRAVGFLDRIELAYAVADLAVARAGASTVAELAACGVPAVFVPYPHATANHQEANAHELERVGAAEVLLDRSLTPASFVASVERLLADEERRKRMTEAALLWAKPDAAARLADLVVEAA